ncbi:ImmA/IrrE family metallo-endopeptidase [Arthrobacter sp. AQ5-05]|uniref:ImmA/IrrE family metallo-endopeptidase n=1 Tax=Arthrobacter sp. AQ5-05 TaxID=2184581 RepID=UPI000DCF49AB|nr:ImmA/IrrE family metallo-endopeptidase [Arthrobacter sp. AQ5-05]RAX50902.1 ImmA/IrrE family metallo-endopeptidase [Arthrobacter sp. AQ5-05]
MLEIPPGVRVIWRRPRPDIPAATNGTDKVWVDPALSQTEIRCSLAHELVHLERGHVGHQPPAIEKEVRYEASRRLISITQLRAAAAWAQSRADLRDELHVTDMVLLDRLSCITDDELLILQHATSHHAT